MTAVALARTDRVEIVQSKEQLTLVAEEAIKPGAPVRINGDKFTNGNGTTTTEVAIYGVAVGDQAVAAGQAITAVKRGILDGFTLSGATNSAIYVSDTDGRLDTAAGTQSKVVGRVIPGTATLLGSTAKLLLVEL